MIRSFVDTDAWRNVPYELDGKSWQDRILILAHRVQTVIHRAKEAIQHQHVDPDQAIAVWRDMAILKHALHAWYDAYEVDTVDQERNMNVGTSVNGRPLFWTRPTTGILSEDIWTLPEMIEYRDAEVAETLSFYVSGCSSCHANGVSSFHTINLLTNLCCFSFYACSD